MDSDSADENDPLLALVENSQIDDVYREMALTQPTQPCSQCLSQTQSQGWRSDIDSQQERSPTKLAMTAQRLCNFAASLEDPKNEGDPFYQSLVRVYEYFSRRISFLDILYQIHTHGGRVSDAVRYMSNNLESLAANPLNPDFFDFGHATVKTDASSYFDF